MPDFIIEAYELHLQKYIVKDAKNKEEALKAYEDGEADCVDNGGEYIQMAEEYHGKDLPPAVRSIEEV